MLDENPHDSLLFDLDIFSSVLTLDPNFSFREIDQRLNLEGFCTGYFYPPSNDVSLKKVLEKNLENLYAPLYGEIHELCVALEWTQKDGSKFQTSTSPRQATGPSWKNWVMGAGTKLCKFKEATLRVFRVPEEIEYTILPIHSFEESFLIEKQLKRHELIPQTFGRFEKAELLNFIETFPKNEAGFLKKEYFKLPAINRFLILEWCGSRKWVAELQKALKHILGPRQIYDSKQISNPRILFNLLRNRFPKPAWTGLAPKRSSRSAHQFRKQLLEALC